MKQAWIDGPYAAFDVESTGVDPFTARIVTATIVEVGATGLLSERHWLVNPGVEIPAEASAIHGVTTERARAEGMAADEAAYQIISALRDRWSHGMPLVVFHSAYDLTVLDSEIGRHHGPEYTEAPGPVLDPLVIDRALDRYRKGKRTLLDCCAAYGVRQDDAHSSAGDALAAARLAWRMAHSFEWLAGMTLAELQTWQAERHRLWAENFEAYLRSKGRDDVIEREWPVRRHPATREAKEVEA